MSRSDAELNPEKDSEELQIEGQLLDERYLVGSLLGQGGMASVYRAKDERLDRLVVVKIPHARLLDEGFRKRFKREVSSLTQLEHPAIVQIHDVGEHEGTPFAVVQFLKGGDLTARIRKGGGLLTPTEVAEWLIRIAETLDFVYERGFVHRDVSPGNIIFDEHNNAFLSDFGIATAMAANDPDETLAEFSDLTKPGGFVGAAPYAPPESIERKLNPGYDQYSLGVVVYESLCGQLPFPRTSSGAMLRAKITQPPQPLDAHIANLPPGVVSAVMRAISQDPAGRFESSAAFARAFEDAISARPLPIAKTEVAGAAPTPTLPERTPASGGSRGWIAAISVLALLAVGGVAGWQQGLLDDLLRSPEPVEFQAGSSEAEQQFAYELCVAELSAPACARTDYLDEVLRTVSIGPIEIDSSEVTNRQFAAFVEASGHRTIAEKRGQSFNGISPGTGLSWRAPIRGSSYLDRLELPVVHVSRVDAETYCAAQGGRLPSEEEWEFGARGEQRRIFPWGNEWKPDRANWNSSGAVAVGQMTAGDSWDGLHDMAGNVWEWTSSETSTAQGAESIMKGGSWLEKDPASLRAAARLLSRDLDTSVDVGFRCVRDL